MIDGVEQAREQAEQHAPRAPSRSNRCVASSPTRIGRRRSTAKPSITRSRRSIVSPASQREQADPSRRDVLQPDGVGRRGPDHRLQKADAHAEERRAPSAPSARLNCRRDAPAATARRRRERRPATSPAAAPRYSSGHSSKIGLLTNSPFVLHNTAAATTNNRPRVDSDKRMHAGSIAESHRVDSGEAREAMHLRETASEGCCVATILDEHAARSGRRTAGRRSPRPRSRPSSRSGPSASSCRRCSSSCCFLYSTLSS